MCATWISHRHRGISEFEEKLDDILSRRAQVVQAELDTGRWVLEELATAMRISLLASESVLPHFMS
jgi:hypothetical protein